MSRMQYLTSTIKKRARQRTTSTDSGSIGSFSGFDLLSRKTLPNDERLVKRGNIFLHRPDWLLLSRIPLYKQNPVHIKLEDEGPFGNDESRCALLSQLSSMNLVELNCIVCEKRLPIFDRYPLVDGTLFISQIRHKQKDARVPVNFGRAQSFLYAVCVECEHSSKIICKFCQRPWDGSMLIVGTMYHYDIFCANPCCSAWYKCRSCGEVAASPDDTSLSYFSAHSEEHKCINCGVKSFHFLKPFESMFYVEK